MTHPFQGVLQLIHDCRRIGIKPPSAIMLQTREDGRAFEQYCKRECSPMTQFSDAEKLAEGPYFMKIGDAGFGYVEVYGVRVMWPAEKYAPPRLRDDFEWRY